VKNGRHFNDLNQIYEKDAEKRCVVRFDLKSCKVLDEVTSDGRLFQVFVVATGKARSPIIQNHVDGTASAEVEDGCSRCPVGI